MSDRERTFPESWKPATAGDAIQGAFVRLDTGYGKSGDTSPIVILRDEDGIEHGLWLWHSVLRADFARLRPKVDEIVTVTYLGKRTSATGRSYHNYSVQADRESQLTWDDLEDVKLADTEDKKLPFAPMAEKLAPFRKSNVAKPTDDGDEEAPF